MRKQLAFNLEVEEEEQTADTAVQQVEELPAVTAAPGECLCTCWKCLRDIPNGCCNDNPLCRTNG